MATLKDIAQRAGVTATTVSRVINNRGYISEGTRKKVYAAMEEMHYQPNELARAFSKQYTNTIGLIVPHISHPFFIKVISNLESSAAEKGFKLLLCNSKEQPEKEQDYLDMCISNRVAGIVLCSKYVQTREFRKMNIPVVNLERGGDDDTISVQCDNYQGGKLAAEKTGKAATLEGVFSVAGSEKWTYGDHFVNIAVDAIFPDSKAAGEATLEQLQAGKGAFEAYAKALDLKTANATTPRGPELINATTNGYDPSVATFANSKAIFLKQGNWAYENIKKANADIVDTLTFLPIKMPFTQDDIKVEGLTVEHMLESIPVFVPNYYCINDKVSDEEKELAEEFLVWLNTTEAGQKFVVEEMSFIPYNADPATTSAGYSLGDSIISYMAADKTLTNAYAGAPKGWATDNFGLQMMENYVNTAEWPETAYSDIADYAISSWAEMAGLE